MKPVNTIIPKHVEPVPASEPIGVKTKSSEPVAVIQSDHLIIDTLPDYTGQYSVTPTGERVVLDTNGKGMNGNVIVEPIPSNYGLITWDGFKLVIS